MFLVLQNAAADTLELMIQIHETINELTGLLKNETGERHLLDHGTKLIESLRKAWKVQKNEFSQDIINSLQKSASQLEAISEFIEEEEDFGCIDTQDDADETIGRLYPLIELTEGLAVAGRINKEIRELVERKSSLPPRTLKQHETELKNIINKLNANAPTCKRKNCDCKMVIRQGNGAYFWGCSAFPKCWNKQWLKKEELELLPD